MSEQENIEAIRRYVSMWDNKVWHWSEKDDWSEYLQVIDEDFVVHYGSETISSLEAFAAGFKPMYIALPDFHGEIDEIFAAGDRVACRFRGMGTHTGPFGDIKPSGETVEWTGTGIYRMKNGRYIEAWVNDDSFSLMQQLGAIPSS